MNCMSINVQGIGNINKHVWIRKLCINRKVNFLAIQEKKSNDVGAHLIRSLWGNNNFDFVAYDAQGASGGIVVIWEIGMFVKKSSVIHEKFVAVFGVWTIKNINVLMVSVYFQQDLHKKREVWRALLDCFAK